MAKPRRDLLALARKRLFVSVLSDTLDGMGLRDQAVSAKIRPLDEELVMLGRARTGLYREVYHVADGENPYELEIKLIDDLKPGEIPVLACGVSGRIAPWGELLTTASRARKAAGSRHRRADARYPRHPQAQIPGLPRRHRPARLKRPRPGRGHRRAGGVRRRSG